VILPRADSRISARLKPPLQVHTFPNKITEVKKMIDPTTAAA
jgi:hypothetical protein